MSFFSSRRNRMIVSGAGSVLSPVTIVLGGGMMVGAYFACDYADTSGNNDMVDVCAVAYVGGLLTSAIGMTGAIFSWVGFAIDFFNKGESREGQTPILNS